MVITRYRDFLLDKNTLQIKMDKLFKQEENREKKHFYSWLLAAGTAGTTAMYFMYKYFLVIKALSLPAKIALYATYNFLPLMMTVGGPMLSKYLADKYYSNKELKAAKAIADAIPKKSKLELRKILTKK